MTVHSNNNYISREFRLRKNEIIAAFNLFLNASPRVPRPIQIQIEDISRIILNRIRCILGLNIKNVQKKIRSKDPHLSISNSTKSPNKKKDRKSLPSILQTHSVAYSPSKLTSYLKELVMIAHMGNAFCLALEQAIACSITIISWIFSDTLRAWQAKNTPTIPINTMAKLSSNLLRAWWLIVTWLWLWRRLSCLSLMSL